MELPSFSCNLSHVHIHSSLTFRGKWESSVWWLRNITSIDVLSSHSGCPGLGGTGNILQGEPTVRQGGQGPPALQDILLVDCELPVEVVDHAGTHPDDDEDEKEEDDDDVRLRHVEGEGVTAHCAGLLVPAKPAVPDAVTHQGLVDTVGVVTVVESLSVGTLLTVFHLLHLSKHGNKLRAQTLLVSVEPDY